MSHLVNLQTGLISLTHSVMGNVHYSLESHAVREIEAARVHELFSWSKANCLGSKMAGIWYDPVYFYIFSLRLLRSTASLRRDTHTEDTFIHISTRGTAGDKLSLRFHCSYSPICWTLSGGKRTRGKSVLVLILA